MKLIKVEQYIVSFLTFFFVCACSSNEVDLIPSGKTPVLVEAGIAIQTRTSQDGSSFVDNDSFILYEGAPATDVKQSKYIYSSGAWSGNPGLFWDDLNIWSSAEIKDELTYFTAVLANGGTLTLGDSNSFAISANQSTNDTYLENDLLVAYGSANATKADSRKLKLVFKHVFAQLKIELTETTNVTEENPSLLGAGTILTLKNAKNGNTISFDAVTGETTASSSGDAVVVTMCNISADSKYVYKAILPAQSLSTTTLCISNNTNGKEYTYSLGNIQPDEGEILQQGMLTTLSLKVEKTQIEVVEVKITKWVSNDAEGLATPTDYPEITFGDDDGGGDDGGLDPEDDYAGKTIKLTSDVEAATLGLPIGTKEKPFRGTFDGQGYTIYNVNIDEDNAFLGVFGYTDGATIKNLNVKGDGITNQNKSTNTATGGLVGYINNTLIDNCHVLEYTNGVNAQYDNIGGLAGYVNGTSTIRNSSANTKVSGAHDYVGGFVGKSEKGMLITECFATGEVRATGYYVGGFIGYSYEGTIEYSYAWGNIYGDRYTGGFIGRTYQTTLNNSYAAGRELTGSSAQGGLIGYSDTDPKYCYWNATLAGGKGATGNSPDETNAAFSLSKREASMGNILGGLNRNTETDIWELTVCADETVLPVLINNKGKAEP